LKLLQVSCSAILFALFHTSVSHPCFLDRMDPVQCNSSLSLEGISYDRFLQKGLYKLTTSDKGFDDLLGNEESSVKACDLWLEKSKEAHDAEVDKRPAIIFA